MCPLGQRTAAPALRKRVSLRPEAVAGRGPRPDGDLHQKRTQDGAGSWAPLLRADPAEAPSNAGAAGNAIKESSPRTKGPQSSMAGLLASWSSPLPPHPPPDSSREQRSFPWTGCSSPVSPLGAAHLQPGEGVCVSLCSPRAPAAERSPLPENGRFTPRRGPGHVMGTKGSEVTNTPSFQALRF